MRLPHITIEVRDEESFAPGKLSASFIVGFGIHWAWILCAAYCTDGFFAFAASSGNQLFYLVSVAALTVTLLLYALFSDRARELFLTPQQRFRNRLIGGGIMTTGMVALFGACLPGPVGIAACVVAGAFTGFGSAVLFMSFAVSSSLCDTATISILVGLSVAASCIVFAIVKAVGDITPAGACFLMTLMPAIETACLQKCSGSMTDSYSFASSTIPVRKLALGVRIVAFSFVFGLVIGIIEQLMFPIQFSSSQFFQNIGVPVVCAGICFCILITCAMLTQRQTVSFSLRTMMPVTALCLFCLMLDASKELSLIIFFTTLAYFAVEGALWICLADLSQRYRISAFVLFGFSRSFIAAGAGVAYLFHVYANEWNLLAWFDGSNPIIPLALLCIVFGASLAPRDIEMRPLLIRPADADSTEFAVDALPSETSTNGVLIDEPSAEQDADEEPTDSAPADEPSAGQDADEEPSAFVGPGQHGASSQNVDPGQAPDNGERIHMGRYKRKCAAVADTYLLSRRETEVLFLLAKGFSGKMIQEKLCISEGTANTHMRHVYRKLNVHSQQEIVRMVDSVVLPEKPEQIKHL